MQDILIYSAFGQLALLMMLTLRQEKSPYIRVLFLLLSWMLLINLTFVFQKPDLYLIVLAAPVLLKTLVFRFFEKSPPHKYLYRSMAALVLITSIYFFSSFKAIGFYYLLLEFIFLSRLLLRLLQQRGISMRSLPRKLNWILFYLITICLTTLFICAGVGKVESLNNLSVGLYFLSITGSAWHLTRPDALSPLKTVKKYGSSSLDQEEKYRILQALDQQVNDQDYLLNPKASLGDLAKKIHTTPHQLSQVLNESKEVSFFDLLAIQRVRAAKKLLREEASRQLTIEEIGERVGYMSKSSFNTVFKKITKVTPSEYRSGNVRGHHVERPESPENHDFYVHTGNFEMLTNTRIMISNFFKLYFRRLVRNKTFNTVNNVGLIVGLTSVIFIMLYLQDELSYDKFHSNARDIVRVEFLNGNPQTRTPHPMAQALTQAFPEVESAVSLSPLYGTGLSKQSIYIRNPERDITSQEPDGYAADTTFFQVFNFDLIVGNEHEALKQVGGLIISERMATKYFGEDNPLGKILEMDTERHPVVVTGVMKNVPTNSHFHPEFIVSYVTLKSMNPNNPWMQWEDFGHFNYLKLVPGSDLKYLESKIPEWLYQAGHLSEENYQDFTDGNCRFGLRRITDIHLKSHIRWELEANGNITYIYILFAAIAFILIITSINFINLSTARAFERAREVGVRRSLGMDKFHVSANFFFENILTCLIALLLAFGTCAVTLKGYNSLTDKSFGLDTLFSSEILFYASGFAILIGIISGIVPAITVLGIKVTEILKGKFVSSPKGVGLRKALVAVQFSVSTILIFGSIILFMQVKYLQDRSLGYDDQVLAVKLKSENAIRSIEALKTELRKVKGISTVGTVSNLPGSQFNQNTFYSTEDTEHTVDVSQMAGDYDMFKPLDLKLVSGRWFEKNGLPDSTGTEFIINETAARQMGLEDPVGEKVYWDDDSHYSNGRIIGVIKDFHFQSLHVPIQPLLLTVNYDELNYLLVKLDNNNWKQTITGIESVYNSFDGVYEFESFFLDQKNQQLYDAEKRSLKVFNLFAGIALGLAATGLLGLAYLIIVQRTKEIGIRKILGATVSGLLIRENVIFLKLILIGLVVSFPLAFFIMKEWLAGFAYRVDIGPEAYLITAVVIVAIAVVSVTLAILKTVLANPSEALRYE